MKARVTKFEIQLNELRRQQKKIIASAPPSKINHRNYRPIEINPSESLKKTDFNEYSIWAYVIRKKLKTDEPLYPNDKRKVRYAFNQMKDFIFDVMHF